MPQKYFLDCGGHNGCSVRHFRATFPDAQDYLIHSFEPRPEYAPCYADLDGVIFHPQAVWVYDGDIDFFLCDRVLGDGASVLAVKNGTRRRITVPCLDFSQWLLRTFRPEDHIILKMDIEGAEYEVLNRMADDGSLAYVDRLLIEFHHEKIGLSQEAHDVLLKRLEGIPVEKWNGLKREKKLLKKQWEERQASSREL